MSDRAARDPGLQPERTLLAWRRTALALVVLSALATRLLAVELGPVAASLGAVGILLAVLAAVSAQLRFRATLRDFAAADAGERPLPSGGRTLALITLASLALGAAGVALILALS